MNFPFNVIGNKHTSSYYSPRYIKPFLLGQAIINISGSVIRQKVAKYGNKYMLLQHLEVIFYCYLYPLKNKQHYKINPTNQ
jgi:hypothetical protein